MVVRNMYTNKPKYYDRIINGYMCTFDSVDHICVSVLFATGMDKAEWEKFKTKMIGSVDPNYNN